MVKGMGGAMDLAQGAKKVVVMMEHVSKGDTIKILKEWKLPLTGLRSVNQLITDMAVFEWDSERNMILKEIAHDTTVDKVRALTEAEFIVSDDLGEFGHEI